MTPDGTGSIVRWTYSFYPLPNRRLILRRIIAPMLRRYAAQSLRRAVDVVQSTASTRPS
jgi:hypothetical protein